MKWFLFLILASLPAYQIRFKIFGLPTTLLEIMIIILFACWLINKLKSQKSKVKTTIQNLKSSRWFWIFLIWLIIGITAVIISPNKWLALGHWRAYFFEPILFLIVFLDLIKTKKDLNLAFFALGVSALYCCLWAIGQKFFGGGMLSLETWQYPLRLVWRATGLFPQSNFLGLFLSPLIILFIGQCLDNFKNKKFLISIYYFLVSILSILAIIFARSEGAIIGLIAGSIFFLLISLKKKQRLIFILILLFVICYLLFVSPWKNYLLEKVTFQDLSGKLRLNIWQGTIELIKDRPIFGAGLRGYQKLISQYQKPFSLPSGELISEEIHPYPHNLFLAIWSELGIFGLIVFLVILIRFFYEGFKQIKKQQVFHFSFLIFNLSAMVSLLTHGAFDTPYFKNDLSILFWLIIALLIISKNLDFSSKN